MVTSEKKEQNLSIYMQYAAEFKKVTHVTEKEKNCTRSFQ
jgi:hypothetical protein